MTSLLEKREGPRGGGGAPGLSDDDVLLTRREAAEYLRRSVATLERWASVGSGPPAKRVGGRVLYSLSGLRTFVGLAPKDAA